MLASGAHYLKKAKDIGGSLVEIVEVFTDKQGNIEESSCAVSIREMKDIQEWMNRDRKAEARERVKQSLKVY